jgi:transposase
MAALCGEFGILRKTGYKIYAGTKRVGAALTDRSRRPYRQANRLPVPVEALDDVRRCGIERGELCSRLAATAHRRSELQALYQHLDDHIDRLDERVKHVANERPRATLLMTHPGVGPVTALATDVFVGDPAKIRSKNTLT